MLGSVLEVLSEYKEEKFKVNNLNSVLKKEVLNEELESRKESMAAIEPND